MKLRNLLIALLVVAILVPVTAFARDDKFQNNGELSIWSFKPHGSLNLGNNNYSLRTNIQGDKTSGFGNKTTAGFGWNFNIGKLSDVYVGFTTVKDSGTLRANGTGNVTIDGKNFGAAGVATINTDLKLDIFDILGGRELTRGENGFVDFIYGIKFMKMNFNATDAANANTSASYSLSVPMLNLGLRGVYYINNNWNLYGSFSGFSINRSGKSGTLKSLDAGVEYHFAKHNRGCKVCKAYKTCANCAAAKVNEKKVEWYAQLGYKAEYIKGTDNQNTVVLDHEGPQLKIVGRF